MIVLCTEHGTVDQNLDPLKWNMDLVNGHHCLPRAKMARRVRRCPTDRSQHEETEEPERDPQQEKPPDATEGKDVVDYDPDVDYEWSELENELVAQDQREVDPNAEYAK